MQRSVVGLRTIILAVSLATIPLAQPSSAQTAARAVSKPALAAGDTLLGEWWTENNEGRIRFTRDANGTYRGTTTCCVPEQPSEKHPAIDSHNPNPKLRGRSTVGIVLIWKLAYDNDDGEYADGYVYNPRDGKSYRFEAKLIDQNTLKIRGYMGIPLFGESQIWKRVQSKS